MAKASVAADLTQIVSDIFALERQKAGIQEEIAELKRAAFQALYDQPIQDQPISTQWSKAALAEAFRLMRVPKESRDVTLTQANKILRSVGRGEIDLNAFC